MGSAFRIVSLCGSAGALGPYIEIIRTMPVDSGMAFVVMTHRREATSCLLVDILSVKTTMQVEVIGDGMEFEPNHVYVNPGGEDVTIDGTKFRLAPTSKLRGWPDSFDIYLRSVARSTFNRAVTVILSGMDVDGTAAMGDLRRAGGINYAQNDAVETSMPRSAVGTGSIDYEGSPSEIAAAILGLLREDRVQVVQ